MNKNLNKLKGSALCDILDWWGIPTNTIQELWNQHQEKCLSASRDVLFDEIKQGNFNNIEDDDKISILHRYTQASMNGVARINLRLMAKLINSMLKNENISTGLYASRFNRYSSLLETLSYEEILILATTAKYGLQMKNQFSSLKDNLAMEYLIETAKIMTYEQYEYTMIGLLRTGLVKIDTGFSTTYSPLKYSTTILLDKIIELVDFQDALDKEAK